MPFLHFDIENPGTALDRSGHPNPVPRITGKVRRKHPVEVRDVEFLRKNTDHMIKMTVPGPFTMSQQAQNEFYTDEEEMAFDYAAAVNVYVGSKAKHARWWAAQRTRGLASAAPEPCAVDLALQSNAEASG